MSCDAPVVRLARHRPIREIYLRSIYFRNFKGAAETIREIMPSVPFVPERARRNYAKAVVHVPVLMLPLISVAYSVLLLILNNKLGWKFISPGTKTLGKVAIIGAGPAGLQASVTLTNQVGRHDL